MAIFLQKICALLLVLLFCCEMANARDLYTIGAEDSSTSDDIDLTTFEISYINNQREHLWPYNESADSDWDFGFALHRYNGKANGTDFTGYQLEAVLGWRYSSSTYFGGKIGDHNLDVQSLDQQEDRTTYDFSALVGLADSFSINLGAADDYVYQFGLQPAGAREFLHAERWQAGFELRPIETVRVIGSGSLWELSDANNRHEGSIKMIYGISPGWPWIWAGVSYEQLGYDVKKPDYWTPEKFRSLGFEFESSFPLTENISGALSASISRIKEDNFPEGNGDSIFAGIDYKVIDDLTLRVGASRIHSKQESSSWSEEAYRLSLNGSF